MRYIINTIQPVAEDYLCRGFIWGLIANGLLDYDEKDRDRPIIKEECLPYLYRTIAKYKFENLPSEEQLSYLIKENGVDKKNEKHFYYGAIEAFFKDCNIYNEKDIKERIEEVTASGWIKKEFLYEGLGLSLGYLAFGDINKFTGFVRSLLDNDGLSHFYYGYCLSLKERYGEDLSKITELIDSNVPEGFKKQDIEQ
ncbi:hypothetical protein ACFL0P_07535 [Candidatus Omnitrophota bacterium]